MVYQCSGKLSVRVSPRVRGSLFYSEWEIIELDNVKKRERRKRSDNVLVELLICSRWYCEERKKNEKSYWDSSIGGGYDLVDVTVVYGSNSLFLFVLGDSENKSFFVSTLFADLF